MICAKLKYINNYNETFWFVELGEPWPNRPELRLIKTTSPQESDAKCFESAEEAAAVLVACDNPVNWTIVVTEVDSIPKPTEKLPLQWIKNPKLHKAKPLSPGHR